MLGFARPTPKRGEPGSGRTALAAGGLRERSGRATTAGGVYVGRVQFDCSTTLVRLYFNISSTLVRHKSDIGQKKA